MSINKKHLRKILENAEITCKAQGARFTPKRKEVLEGLLHLQKAVSAYELADYCSSQKKVSMPIMSVYRILSFLQELQLVHKLSIANKFVACSHIACDHAHDVPQFLICSNCQKVKEIGINKKLINSLQSNIEDAGYQLECPQLEMSCICKDCAKKKI